MIDYIMREGKKLELLDVEVVYVGMQHRLVTGVFDWKGEVEDRNKSNGRIRRLRIWKLKDEKVREEFAGRLRKVKLRGSVDASKRWEDMKKALLKAMERTCGRTRTEMCFWPPFAKQMDACCHDPVCRVPLLLPNYGGYPKIDIRAY